MSKSSSSETHRQPLAGPVLSTVPIEIPPFNPIGMPVPRPEFYALPPNGGRDPHFSCSRAWYYAAEKAGLLKLVRIRHRGKLRGITRVAYDDVAKLFAEAREQDAQHGEAAGK